MLLLLSISICSLFGRFIFCFSYVVCAVVFSAAAAAVFAVAFLCVNRLFSPRSFIRKRERFQRQSLRQTHQRSAAEQISRMKKPARTMERDFLNRKAATTTAAENAELLMMMMTMMMWCVAR